MTEVTEAMIDAAISARAWLFLEDPTSRELIRDIVTLAMRAASNSPPTNGELTETLRTAIIQTLMACTDKMCFDLAGNDFAYVANELLNGPIANLTPRAASDDVVEHELFLKRQWRQEAERARRLVNEVRALHRQLDEARVPAAPDVVERLREALIGMTQRYVGLVNSGDAGFWNPEEEPEVIAARAALSDHTTKDDE